MKVYNLLFDVLERKLHSIAQWMSYRQINDICNRNSKMYFQALDFEVIRK